MHFLKRIFLLILLIQIGSAGCDFKTDIQAKKECSKYVNKAKIREAESNYYGTYYSREKKTCISIYWRNEGTYFYDELTGSNAAITVGVPPYQRAVKKLRLVGFDGRVLPLPVENE